MKALIVANWKMHPKTFKEAKALLAATKHMTALTKGVSVVIVPPSLFLRELSLGHRAGRITFGAQHAHFEGEGSHTGEISMAQVKDAKATYVIIGHAERRAMGETNEDVQKKVAAALFSQLTPIVCIGEGTRGTGAEHFNEVREQLRVGLRDVPEKRLSKIIIAYEPVWAIGGAVAMQPRDMHEMSIFIRKTLIEKFGASAHNITILYGGSVDAHNASDMLRNGDVAGLLVGRASAEITSMTELLRAVHEA